MAKKTPPERITRAPDDRPLQWSDLDATGQRVVAANMANWGKARTTAKRAEATMRSRRASASAASTDKSLPKKKQASAERTVGKLDQSLAALEEVSPHLKDTAVTLETAATRRVSLIRGSARRASQQAPLGLAGGSALRAAGVGWYFDHRQHLNNIASQHSVDEDSIVTASAVMSPSNSPDSEKAAVGALAHMHSTNPTLVLSEYAQKKLGVSRSSLTFSELDAKQASLIGSPSLRKHIGGVDQGVLEQWAKGGTNENMAKAVDVVRGNIHHEDAINPHSAPKVWSYRDSISKAIPGSNEHMEYMSRAQTALFEAPGQTRLDLFGLQSSTEGILNPTKTTAEDTWEGAVSSGQQLESVGSRRHKQSPAKFVASEKTFTDQLKKTAVINKKKTSAIADPRIGANATTHAFHNEAVIRAASQLSQASGEIIPSVLAQEVPWTESRRIASKDKPYEGFISDLESQAKTTRQDHFNTGRRGSPKQLKLF